MEDPRYVYRPMLNLIGHTEGTDKGRGYNETLSYGAYTDGAVDLVIMTLDEIDALQSRMLRHPKNYLKSSAIGRYQIIRTTLRWIRSVLDLTGSEKYDEKMQDKLACFLLGFRGIDKWLAGDWTEDRLINNLAEEWASLPTTRDVGYHEGQNAAVKSARVRAVLAEVRARHDEVTADTPEPVEPLPGASLPETATLEDAYRLAELPAERLQAGLLTIVFALGIKQGFPIGDLIAPPAQPRLTFSPEQPEQEKTMQTKSFLKSRTLWGAALTAISYFFPSAAPLVLPLQDLTQVDPELSSALAELMSAIGVAVGLATTVYGRFKADRALGLKG